MKYVKAFAVKLAELILGISSLSIGITLGIISGLGQTTSTSTSSAISAATGLKVGTAMFVLYSLFLIAQLIILNKDFKPIRLLQLIPIFMQMGILNYFKYDFEPLQLLSPESYPARFVTLMAGIALISLGFTIVRFSEFINYPPEAFFTIIADRLHIRFGTVKIGGDIFYIAATCVICLISGNKIDMVREGTLIFAVLNGNIINFYTPVVKAVLTAAEKLLLKVPSLLKFSQDGHLVLSDTGEKY